MKVPVGADEREASGKSHKRLEALGEWLAGHHGVVSIGRMVALGYSRPSVYRMVDRGELVVLLPGVFKGIQWPTGREQRMVAACMRNDSISIGYLTAAKEWSFRKVPHDPNIHLLVPHTCSAKLLGEFDGYVVHRCRQIDPVDIVQRDDGIRLISPTRAAFDIADVVLEAATGSILEQLINDNRGTIATHAATFIRLGHPQRPGTQTMGRVLASRPLWRAAMQSDLESRVLDELRRRGLPSPEVQYPIRLPNGQSIRLDFAWPNLLEALEVDHPFWHDGVAEAHRDKRRDRMLATIGWHTTRITDFDVNSGLHSAMDDLTVILDAAARRLGS